ncbi:MAG: hypothetical protein JOZ71_00715 [Ktedonobacteraceae bacterium]|nr:hypothetical protein [Ktedonobacteraceae bacterium]
MQEQPFTFSSNRSTSVDADLVQIDPYIVMLTKRLQRSDLSEHDCEEIAQSVRIKLAGVLPGKEIHNFGGYLRRVVRNELVTFLRGRRLYAPLLLTEEGDPCAGRLLICLSEGMNDPQVVYEQKMAFAALVQKIVDAVLALPPVQKKAMMCFLPEKFTDPTLLILAFRRRGVDITNICWPVDKVAKQRLQASCRPALLRLARSVGINLAHYKLDKSTERNRLN